MSQTSTEVTYLKDLRFEILGRSNSIMFFRDFQSTQKIALNSIFHQRTKHLDIRYRVMKENIAKNFVKISHLETADMSLDI